MNLAHGGHLTHGMARQLLRPAVRGPRLRRARRTTERIDYDAMASAGEGGPAEAHRRRGVGVPADPGTSSGWPPSPTTSARCCSSTWPTSPVSSPPGVHPSPFPHADLVTTTTHKTLRGPRGGLVFAGRTCRERRRGRLPGAVKGTLAAAIDTNVFPGIQGGPLMHVIAGQGRRASARGQRGRSGEDQRRTVENAAVLAETLAGPGARVVSRRHGQPPDAGRRDAARRHRARRPSTCSTRSGSPSTRTPSRSTQLPPNTASRHPHRDAGHHDARLRRRTRCARSGRIIIDGHPRARGRRPRRAGSRARCAEIVARFPVPGLLRRDPNPSPARATRASAT